MNLLDLEQQSLAVAIAAYVAAAAVVWIAGTKASHYADQVSRRTGIGGAVVGMVLLGTITSLPEIGTSATAALSDNAELAVANLLGGVAFQIVVLAIVDAFIGRTALTSTIPNPGNLLQAIVCVLLLALAVAGTIAGELSVLGVGAWSIGMLLVYGVSVFFVHGQEKHAVWVPNPEYAQPAGPPLAEGVDSLPGGEPEQSESKSLDWRLVAKIAFAGALILFAGYVLTRSAEAISAQTGISANVAGMTLLALATSLPELSTAIAAVRIGRNDIAIGDVLGGNMFDLMLIFFVDLLYPGPPVLSQVGGFASFAGLLGIILTAIFLIGMIERRNRTIFKMGFDSLLVLLCYAGGIGLIIAVGSGS